MTVYDHAMAGLSLALAAGLHRRYGWSIAVLAGVAAALPDWHGLSILFGPGAYAHVHRVWGHNLLAASVLGGLAGGLTYAADLPRRLRRLAAPPSPVAVA